MTQPFQSSIRAVLFDLDGTLMDTAPDFLRVLEQLAHEYRIMPPSRAAVLETVSAGARALVSLAFGLSEADEGFSVRHRRLLELYGQFLEAPAAQLYPGMGHLLTRLEEAGLPWGVVTNKPLPYSRRLLEALTLNTRCASLICPEHVSHTKPDPEPLLLACRELGGTPATTIYVGDHPRDIEAGHRAGMTSAAAAWGYLPGEPSIEQWGADVIVAYPEDLEQRIIDGGTIATCPTTKE